MRYLVLIEEGPSSYGAYVPDLPGCAVAAESREEALELIAEAIEFHLDGLREQGVVPPSPHTSSELVDVRAA
jgi:predicted RNase H-like HicB family nuclease